MLRPPCSSRSSWPLRVSLTLILQATPACSRSGPAPRRFGPGCWPPNALAAGPAQGTGALDPAARAVLVLHWFYEATRVTQLARANTIITGGDNQVLSAPDGWPIWATRASPPRSWCRVRTTAVAA